MFELEVLQLNQEIRRHIAMASITGGVIRDDHLRAARALGAVQERMEGNLSRQESKSEKSTVLHRPPFWVKNRGRSAGGKSRGS